MEYQQRSGYGWPEIVVRRSNGKDYHVCRNADRSRFAVWWLSRWSTMRERFFATQEAAEFWVWNHTQEESK